MAITLWGTNVYGLGVNGGTSSPGYFSGGDLIVVGVSFQNTTTITSVSDNMGNTYLPLTAAGFGGSNTQIWYSYNATTGIGHTWTVSGSAIFCSMSAVLLIGATTASDPFIAENANGTDSGAISSMQTGSVACDTAGAAVTFLGDFTNNGTGASIDSGFTNANDIGYNTGTWYPIHNGYKLSPSATENPTWSFTSADHVSCVIASFAAAGGGGGGNPWYAYAQQRQPRVRRTFERRGALWTPKYELKRAA